MPVFLASNCGKGGFFGKLEEYSDKQHEKTEYIPLYRKNLLKTNCADVNNFLGGWRLHDISNA